MDKHTFLTGSQKPLFSVILVIGLTLVALFAGRLLKDTLENQTFVYEHAGIKAEITRGWGVQNGIQGENMLFATSDPFDLTHRYIVTALPAAVDHVLTDSVVTRNLERGLTLQNYQVLDQAAVKIGGEPGFRVGYVYVDTPRLSNVPVVIRGVDYYIAEKDRVLVVSLEDQSSRFEEVYPAFLKFLNKLRLVQGG